DVLDVSVIPGELEDNVQKYHASFTIKINREDYNVVEGATGELIIPFHMFSGFDINDPYDLEAANYWMICFWDAPRKETLASVKSRIGSETPENLLFELEILNMALPGPQEIIELELL